MYTIYVSVLYTDDKSKRFCYGIYESKVDACVALGHLYFNEKKAMYDALVEWNQKFNDVFSEINKHDYICVSARGTWKTMFHAKVCDIRME